MERASRLNRGEEVLLEHKAIKDEQDDNRIVLDNLPVEHAELRKSADAARELADA